MPSPTGDASVTRGPKKSVTKNEAAQNETLRIVLTSKTPRIKSSAIEVKRYSHCLIRCTIEYTAMTTPKPGGTTESSVYNAAMVGRLDSI
ncbi:hypothetical protein J6590_090384 [Homalodisca vitripennis]|nr:hypothetical protein J6590_090384 [Homalodisca vitripennis]